MSAEDEFRHGAGQKAVGFEGGINAKLGKMRYGPGSKTTTAKVYDQSAPSRSSVFDAKVSEMGRAFSSPEDEFRHGTGTMLAYSVPTGGAQVWGHVQAVRPAKAAAAPVAEVAEEPKAEEEAAAEEDDAAKEEAEPAA